MNLGTNRWMLRPEVGASKALGRLTLEAAVAASFFTTNHEFYGGKSREQDLIYSVRGNSVVQLRNGAWVSINATYYAGGRSTVDRALQDDRIASSRVAGILTLPVNRRNSVKLHGSAGVLGPHRDRLQPRRDCLATSLGRGNLIRVRQRDLAIREFSRSGPG